MTDMYGRSMLLTVFGASQTGQETKTGAPVEQFGEGREAQAAAGHKGADISNSRSTEAKQEAGRKAARTR